MHTTFDAWPRLLATFRLIHQGCDHPDLKLIAYGGRLFDPERFTMLEDRRLRIPNEISYQILRALCFAATRLGAQRLSYRSLDIEQIGTVYEGLLDYTVKRALADEPLVVFEGKQQAIRPLAELESNTTDELADYLKEQTGFTALKVAKLLEQAQTTPQEDADAVERDARLRGCETFVATVIEPVRMYLAHETGLRKGQGTYYTPKWITSFIVERTLEPLVHEGEGEDRRIKSPAQILSLKVCDPAMGSGAFLVQACRYLADRLVQSWDLLAAENPHTPLTMPLGGPATGAMGERLIPDDHEEAVTWARRYIAEHCLYGVDINRLAVELAKVSLWLITLSRDKPFEFLDHKLKQGNSIIGCRTEDLNRYPVKAWGRKGMGDEIKETLKQVKKDAREQAKRQEKDHKAGILSLVDVDIAGILDETAREHREIDLISTLDPWEKERLYHQNIVQDERYQGLKRMFDAWCALWFWPIEGGQMSDDLPLAFAYPELLGSLAGAPPPLLSAVAEERLGKWSATVEGLREQESFFHWELEFPEVFEEERGGFDAVVMNPPWERIKLQEIEFFAARQPELRPV